MDELDEKLARIDRRLEARRSELRSRLETAPELASLLEGWKAAFGPLRVTYVQIGDWSDGDPGRQPYWKDGSLTDIVDAVAFVPAPYHRPQTARRGKVQAMRDRERAGR